MRSRLTIYRDNKEDDLFDAFDSMKDFQKSLKSESHQEEHVFHAEKIQDIKTLQVEQ